MPERDDTGDQLRREFLRQAPVFDLQATLPGKVSALVRRRRVRRRVVMAVAAVVVAAAVAVPLAALRSTPVGHGPTPITRPTTPSTTPPTSSPPNSTPTSTAPTVPLACDTLDLWDTPVGTAVTTSAGLGAVTATLTGTAALAFAGGDPSLTAPVLTVTVEGHRFAVDVVPPAQATTVIPWSLAPMPSTATAPTSDALCVAQFPGARLPTVLLGLSTGGAHCCTVVRAIGVGGAGLSAAVDDNMGNPGAALEPDGDDAMIVTADNAFAYQFSSYAASGLPLKLLQFSRGRFVDITSQRPDLLAADAAKWWTAFNADPGNGLGVLAPWVADQCALGQSTSAWATVGQLLAEGKLVGPAGWPEGSAYVEALKTFLAKEGRC